MVTAAPFRSISLAVTARLLKGAVPPTAPPRITLAPAPPAVTVKARGVKTASLLTVEASVTTAAAPLAASVVSAPRITASPKLCEPLLRTLPPLSVVLPPALVLRLLSSSPEAEPPTAPTKVVLPLSARLSERAVPSDMSVPATVMPTPVKVVLAPRVTGPV